ncbi:SDR family NAD(P)-dependent oxidoreductase, partial [Tahibacter sp. P2K]|nr:SDR family NAD(P)-dependent oxidoreductase [Tahibacter harae]
MSEVGEVYQGSSGVDHFNATVAEAVACLAEQRQALGGQPALRILEIGAGTGATSAAIFARLRGQESLIAEYCYTDLSRAFLLHAQDSYAAVAPYLVGKIFNVENDPEPQGIPRGSYDIVVATNVLHATRDIRRTLRNAKAALSSQGVLLLNEMSTGGGLFTHLTFGLTKGWWLFEDEAIRIPGSPAVWPATWQRVLQQEGFHGVGFPAEEAHGLGQTIIVAQSDGVVRQRAAAQPKKPAAAKPAASAAAVSAVSGAVAARVSEQDLQAHVHAQVLACLASSLRVDTQAIDPDESFADYGLDSILGVRTAGEINQALGIELTTTSLFDYPSVSRLSAHIAETYGNAIRKKLQQAATDVAPPPQAAVSPPAAASPQQISAHVHAQVVACLASSLRVDPAAIDGDESFADYGLDSILGVRTAAEINQNLGIELTTTSLFDYPSVNRLAAHIAEVYADAVARTLQAGAPAAVAAAPANRFAAAPAAPGRFAAPAAIAPPQAAAVPVAEVASPAVATPAASRAPIAVIGMSGRYPQSRNVDELWSHLAAGRDLLGPATRWPGLQQSGGQHRGGFLADIDQFDPLFFSISGAEARYMDPQQRLFLQEAWTALEDAGHAGAGLEAQSCGVYVGSGGGDYDELFDTAPAQAFWGNAGSVIPARVSYYLNLQGPAVTVDTACSSSLVAIHLACQGLWTGEIRMALAGGVFIQCTPTFFVASTRAGMLSPTGRCYTFDDRADGFVTGEGVGAVVLKRLADAVADGDHIHGVIRAAGINQDGTTNGITAPSALSQERLERQVYDDFGIDPDTIQLVEAHGTGTKLGDPIEFRALTNAFRRSTARTGYCAIGSIKTNVGHAAAAAGVASLLKVLLALRHKQMPPSLNFEQGNSHIDFANSPFFVNTTLREWTVPAGQPRRAVISSFGFSGTNAHLVIDQAPPRQRQAQPRPAYLMALSARTPDQLRQQAQQLADWLGSNSADAGDISYTLLLGRRHFAYRLACVVSDTAQLRQLLAGWLQRGDSAGIHLSNPEHETQVWRREDLIDLRGSLTLAPESYRQRLQQAAVEFVQDPRVDFAPLFAQNDCSRLSLPTYPFARESYWVPLRGASSAVQSEAAAEAVGIAEPLPAAAAAEASAAQPDAPLLFEERWQAAALPAAAPAAGKLLVLLSDPQQQAALRAALAVQSPAVEVVFLARGAGGVAADTHAAYSTALQALNDQYGRFDGAWYLWPLEQPELVRDYTPLVLLIQALALVQLPVARLLLAADCRDAVEQSYAESWIAAGRSLKMVLAQTQAVAVIGAAAERADLAQWTQRLWQEQHAAEAQSVRYTAQGRETLRVHAYAETATSGALRQGGTYVITGGLGGIGWVFAQHLVRTYAANLVLIGRSAPDAKRQAQLSALEAAGGQALYLSCDVADAAALQAALAQARARFGALHGVLHAAGVDGAKHILTKRVDEFDAVLAPKIGGTLALDAALADDALDFICYFSSSSAVLGDFGSVDYAVGNRFELAHAVQAQQRRAEGAGGPRRLAILWPLWRDGGMNLQADDTTHLYLKTSGQRALEADEGVALLERLLGTTASHVLVMAGERARIERYLGLAPAAAATASPAGIAATASPAGTTAAPQRAVAASAAPLAARRGELAGLDLAQCVVWDLSEIAAKLLQLPRARLSPQENLADFGFDSLSLAEFAERLNAHFGLPVTPSLFFKYGTLGRLGSFFAASYAETLKGFYGGDTASAGASAASASNAANSSNAIPAANAAASAPRPPAHGGAAPSAVAAPTSTNATAAQPNEAIAITGLSGRFPQARSVDELWQILAQGRDAVTEIPAERFAWQDYAAVLSSHWLGALPGVAEFDPAFFEISPREAVTMDPRQRLLLQEAYKALEDAGYGDAQLQRQRIGVFVGVEQGDYAQLAGDGGSLIGSNDAILAARLSYALNLRGPAMAINTACSSGLVAAHQAVLSLRAGECEAAIVAGVSLVLSPGSYIAMSQAGMLSPTGRCRAFDRAADGMVPGEAIVALVFKRLSQAQRDGDVIHALVRASGINYDGKTNGITAPNGGAQAELIQAVLAQAQLPATAIEYIVSHGTGTRLGDPVEINALSEVFPVREAPYCALTSTKSNLGHTFAASGLVSLVSLVLALRHETIPASLHCTQPSDYIDWARSPFYVNTANRAWPRREQPRFGALSSFGISGTNAHMIVQSWDEVAPAAVPAAPCLALCLSARSEEALRRRVEDLLAQLRGQAVDNATLWAISYTLWCARQHHAHRVAVVVRDAAQATALLQAWLAGDAGPNVLRGKVARDFSGQAAMRLFGEELLGRLPTLSDAAACQQALQGLAELYCQGYALDWAQAYGAQPPRRVALPTYPFARETYWLQGGEINIAAFADNEAFAVNASFGDSADETVASAGNTGVTRRAALKGLSIAQCVAADLAQLIGDALLLPPSRLEADDNLGDIGFDSIRLQDLAERLGRHYGLPVTPAVFFSHPTAAKLAQWLLTEHGAAMEAFYGPADSAVRPAAAPRAAQAAQAVRRLPAGSKAASASAAEPIAIIGLSGRFPQARTVAEFWTLLREGRSAIATIPAERWDWQAVPDDSGASRWMGAVPGVDEFDPLFFEISPHEAERMDPRQRLLLQEAYKALEDAGYGPAQLAAQTVGMFVGVEQGDYQHLVGAEGTLTGNHEAILAARLAYVLDLNGPAMAINTACSSGLVAVHQAG